MISHTWLALQIPGRDNRLLFGVYAGMLHRLCVRRLLGAASPNSQQLWMLRRRPTLRVYRHFASEGGPAPIPKSTLLATLPPVSQISHLAEIRAINASPKGKKLVVVDGESDVDNFRS